MGSGNSFCCNGWFHLLLLVICATAVVANIDFGDTPLHQTLINGTDSMIRCTVTADPEPMVAWFKDSKRLSSDHRIWIQQDGVLIKQSTLDDEGIYRCRATIPQYGELEYKDIKVEVLTPPKIESYLNITSNVGDVDVEMKCVATGNPLPELVFKRKTNAAAFVNGINIDGRTEIRQEVVDQSLGRVVGVMYISELMRWDDGLYSCTANSSAGQTQVPGHITVQFPPHFKAEREQPHKEVRTWVQKPVNLSCIATSIPNSTVHWYLRNNEISLVDENFHILSNGPIGVLQVMPLDASYFGVYTCRASNILGSSEYDIQLKQAEGQPPEEHNIKRQLSNTTLSHSQNWTNVAPVLWIPNQLVGISRGSDVTLECHTEAFPRSVNYWIDANNSMILSSGRFDVIVAENGYRAYMRLKIKSVQKSDYGTYGCTAKNSYGETSGTVKVYEISRPIMMPDNTEIEHKKPTEESHTKKKAKLPIYLHLGSGLDIQTIKEGDDIYFICNISSNFNANSIRWFKNGTYKVDQDMMAGVLMSGNSLVLQRLRRTSAGNYSCVASNDQGTVSSNVLPLIINYKPACLSSPQKMAVTEGEKMLVPCAVDAWPKETQFAWKFTNAMMTFTSYRVESPLKYNPTSANFYGTFLCWATNSIGRQTDPCRFDIVEKAKLYARPLEYNLILAYWDHPVIAMNTIFGYVVYYTSDEELPLHMWKSQSVHGNRLTTLNNLNINAVYTLRVGIITDLGQHSLSDPVVVQAQLGISTQPSELTASNVSETGFLLSWLPPNYQGEKILAYNIEYKRHTGQYSHKISFRVFYSTRYEQQFKNLEPNSTYSVWVFARTNEGDGLSSFLTVTTESWMTADVPTAPKVVIRPGPVHILPDYDSEILPVYNASVSIHFPAQDLWPRNRGKLLQYKIRYSISGKYFITSLIEVEDGSLTIAKIEDLLPGAEYEFRISASNHKGFGQETYVYYKTLEKVPTGVPLNLNYRFLEANTILFTWNLPNIQYRNGRILRYEYDLRPHDDEAPPDFRKNTETRILIHKIDINKDYEFNVRAVNSMGPGPHSSISVHPLSDPPVAIPIVNGLATSNTSIELWWDIIPYNGKLTGFQVFYTLNPNDTLDLWNEISVPVTGSAELQNLEKNANYLIAVVAMSSKGPGKISERTSITVTPLKVVMNFTANWVTTHNATISWNPPLRLGSRLIKYMISYCSLEKVYLESWQILTAIRRSKCIEMKVSKTKNSLILEDLEPFTTYTINVTALTSMQEYTPPAKITFTTKMAAPPPMVSPAFHSVQGEQEIKVLLPVASEEYGPVSYYYLVVLPENHFAIHHIHNPQTDLLQVNGSFVSAKFLNNYIPATFTIGDGNFYEGFRNKPLLQYTRYKIFVRAVLDEVIHERSKLYTSSPYSSWISLDTTNVAPEELATSGYDGINQDCNSPWQVVGSDCVLIVESELLSWPQARDACKRLNGFLAEPTDFQLLIDFISRNHVFEVESGKYLVGASDIETEDVWRYATSGQLVPNHVWGKGEPNNWKEQDCLCLWNSKKYGAIVSDTWCDREYYYVCQKGLVIPP